MIFATENAIANIISGKKTQTRRLVKEGETITYDLVHLPEHSKDVIETKSGKVKWQVGKEYSVQSDRGRRGLFYCPICFKEGKEHYLLEQTGAKGRDLSKITELCWYEPYHKMQQLKIKITSIRQEHLLDITEEDARKEGYEPAKPSKAKDVFYVNFCEINKKNYLKEQGNWYGWNPLVWVISFSVLGDE